MKQHKRVKILDRVNLDVGWQFAVAIDGATYAVKLTQKYYQDVSLGGRVEPAKLVELAFQFLLEREQPEEILTEFNLRQIETYFPDFKAKIRSYFPKI